MKINNKKTFQYVSSLHPGRAADNSRDLLLSALWTEKNFFLSGVDLFYLTIYWCGYMVIPACYESWLHTVIYSYYTSSRYRDTVQCALQETGWIIFQVLQINFEHVILSDWFWTRLMVKWEMFLPPCVKRVPISSSMCRNMHRHTHMAQWSKYVIEGDTNMGDWHINNFSQFLNQ